MSSSNFDACYKVTASAVASGTVHWTVLSQALRNRITRIDEMIRPVPGFAQIIGHDELVKERERRVQQIEALKAEHMNQERVINEISVGDEVNK